MAYAHKVQTIVGRGTGYETLQTSMAITKELQIILTKVLQPCISFDFRSFRYSLDQSSKSIVVVHGQGRTTATKGSHFLGFITIAV